MRIAATGATGYIGQRFVCAARLAGYEVLALSRHPVKLEGAEWQFFDLADSAQLSLPADIDAVFHLAANTRQEAISERSELEAAKRLIAAARGVSADFVFVSSQAASADAPTAYGRVKWQIERMTLAAGGWVIRPGQVYGGIERGLFVQLCMLVRRWPVLPAFFPAPIVQPVHVDDLVSALLACRQVPPVILCVGDPKGVEFSAFLRAIAAGRTGRFPLFVPVPTLLLRAMVALAGPGLSAKTGLDRLLSLFSLRRMDTTDDLQRLSLTLRTLSTGMTRSGRGRRELVREGCLLLKYVLRVTPAAGTVRRYVRAVEALRVASALSMPALVWRVPVLLAVIDGAGGVDAGFRRELDWRLNAALMLAEASPQGAHRFLGIEQRNSWLQSAKCLALAVFSEMLRRLAQVIFWPILSRVATRGIFK